MLLSVRALRLATRLKGVRTLALALREWSTSKGVHGSRWLFQHRRYCLCPVPNNDAGPMGHHHEGGSTGTSIFLVTLYPIYYCIPFFRFECHNCHPPRSHDSSAAARGWSHPCASGSGSDWALWIIHRQEACWCKSGQLEDWCQTASVLEISSSTVFWSKESITCKLRFHESFNKNCFQA